MGLRATLVVALAMTIAGGPNAKAGPWEDCTNLREDEASFKGCDKVIRTGGRSDLDMATAYYNRGNGYQDRDEPEKAIADYDRALSLLPRNMKDTPAKLADIHHNRGRCYDTVGKEDEALADHTQALTFNPRHVFALNSRGMILRDREDQEGAIADFDKAIRLDPTFASAYYNRGETHLAANRAEQAVADFTKALSLGEHVDYYASRSAAYSQLKKPKEALRDAERAVKLDPDNPLSYFVRGLAYEDLGEKAKAVADIRRVLKLAPDHESAKEALERLGEK
ncbi:MAG: tetratricopeptide repeat protein [Hyphomicrobiaceae bacterium]